ncbi:RidA family protein [Bradyrhizobium viridifuturi]|jgi:2-iminobutanoate/2-iminopropanoate deaminase|uniref:RidA family protein n=1 Tax=Bradyrhizobium TaxID=374 RepID=UPI000396873F|nr:MULTISPECIES: RidA family protein [Bradyrhizobium]ERF84704.1 MAG: arsenate reductase [Bradyrhizobium sp. DFCI-1]OYU61867.1 MAG: RidA/YER057c/UK114 family protein [Bradyrhizobium sp. PARBB1]PSO24338.1 RidA family protein [Bradyrhizobium sp. MOS004]QRI72142.1 RidA family protein [Bradyrhizobium sp. PSBB068]MBR1021837.1 RidA family protein [Bradyrhizobium viridifuturi]
MSITRNIRTPIMHRAVEANGFVFLGGTIADDTSVSMGEQTRSILGKIAGYLKEAGTDTTRVVSASIFVTDLAKKKEMDQVWTEFFGDNLPARATVGVADLGGGALIEVVVTALKG